MTTKWRRLPSMLLSTHKRVWGGTTKIWDPRKDRRQASQAVHSISGIRFLPGGFGQAIIYEETADCPPSARYSPWLYLGSNSRRFLTPFRRSPLIFWILLPSPPVWAAATITEALSKERATCTVGTATLPSLRISECIGVTLAVLAEMVNSISFSGWIPY